MADDPFEWWHKLWRKQPEGTERRLGPMVGGAPPPNGMGDNPFTAVTERKPDPKKGTLDFNSLVKQHNNGRDMFGMGGNGPSANPAPAPAPPPPTTGDSGSAVLEGYMRDIQDRLARSKAVAPTIGLNTAPIDQAKESSLNSLAQALDTVVKSIGTARTNTNSAYGDARAQTQGSYDAIENRSRVEGKSAAKESGKTVSDELAKSASVAMAGINENMTDSDALLREASKNLGGGNAVVNSVQNKVDPNGSSETIRNNISQNYQDRSGNAAEQTGRDINASGRYADTIGTDGASAIADLMATLAGRNNQYDRDIVDAQSQSAGNKASLESQYADKLMSGQLAQQQEQNQVNQQAWQTNTTNDSNALQGMIDLLNQEGAANAKVAEGQASQQQYDQKAKNSQLEILLKGLVGNTDKNTLNPEDIKQLLAAIQ